MKTIDPNEVTEIPMTMDVDGEVATVSSVSVTLETGKGYDIRFPATYSAGVVTCSIKNIKGVVELGERKIRLEAIINDKYYVPLEEVVKIAAPIQVSASIEKKSEEVKEVQFVKASLTVEKEEKPAQAPTVKAHSIPMMKSVTKKP